MIGINSAPLPAAVAQMIAQSLTLLGWGRVPVWRGADGARRSSRRQTILTSCPDRYADEAWWFERQPGYSLGAPSWGWLVAAYLSIARLTPERLRSIDLPVLTLAAERDRLVSTPAIQWAAGLLPRSELHIYLNAAHELLRESDPVRLDALQRIETFLSRHATA
jgi:lysophospholipase